MLTQTDGAFHEKSSLIDFEHFGTVEWSGLILRGRIAMGPQQGAEQGHAAWAGRQCSARRSLRLGRTQLLQQMLVLFVRPNVARQQKEEPVVWRRRVDVHHRDGGEYLDNAAWGLRHIRIALN